MVLGNVLTRRLKLEFFLIKSTSRMANENTELTGLLNF